MEVYTDVSKRECEEDRLNRSRGRVVVVVTVVVVIFTYIVVMRSRVGASERTHLATERTLRATPVEWLHRLPVPLPASHY